MISESGELVEPVEQNPDTLKAVENEETVDEQPSVGKPQNQLNGKIFYQFKIGLDFNFLF